MTVKFLFSIFVLACVGGCAIAPSHPALTAAALPELIPVRDFVADRQSTGTYRVSPDGKKLAWMGVDGTRPAVWTKTIGQNDAKAFQIRAGHFAWSADGKYLAVVADAGGDEDTHIYVGPVEGSATQLVDLTPFEKTASHIHTVVQGGSELVMTTNRRDKKVFDLYKIDLKTGRQALLATNPGGVASWGVDRLGRLRARVLLEGDRSLLQLPDATQADGWKTTAEWGRFEWVRIVDFLEDGQAAWALSNRGRDKVALVRLELATGAETVVYATPEVDVDQVLISRKTHAPWMAHSMPDYPRHEAFDPHLRTRLMALSNDKPAEIYVTSVADDERTMTVAVVTDRGTKNYLYAGNSAEPELLGENSLSYLAPKLSPVQPMSFTSRDGVELHGYLTLPVGVAPVKLPLVLLVHGGPWARDRWGAGATNRSVRQFLANRGYAVLQVNYRGSSGYGRAFLEKAIGEFAGKMHDDLIDGVQWAVKSGVADPARVAIYGASYGGYAALVGVTFTPEVFACAVDVVGPSSLARLLETVPAYWELGMPMWKRYVGDPANPQERKIMDAKSPLLKADRVTKPVLIMHGVNDPRVKLEQSELMVTALKQAGKPVDYVTFKGDGHGNQKWTNNLTMYRKTEDFLAACLGGRSSGFDYYQLGAWAF